MKADHFNNVNGDRPVINQSIYMDIEQLQSYCLSRKGTEETLPFGPDTLVYKVGGKIYLLTGLGQDTLSFNVKCDPEKAIELRELYSCVSPGYHMNKKHWNTILVDGTVPTRVLKEWINHSYELVVQSLPKKTRDLLKD